MYEFEFLRSLIIIFGISALGIFILNKLRIPSIVGFLISGMLIGPHGLELIKDVHLVEIFAEIGVVLLLFTIGLEFSLKKIFTLRKAIFVIGFMQVLITFLAVVGICLAFLKFDMNTSLIMGSLISLSSTAIVMKLLFDRGEIDSPHGRISLGILIFQDLSVVLFMMMIPVLGGTEKDILKIIKITGESVVIILLVILSARWLVPLLLHQIVRTRMRELFIISIIFICLGAAYLTYRLGLSLAIGAFIAGLIISESEYSYQAISDVLPFKDSFNGLFFISIGMLMDIDFLLENLGMVIISVVGVVLLKTLISTGIIFSLWSNLRVSLQSGLILSQIGEFSFILSVAAMKQGLMQEEMYQLFLSSAIVTMLLTPLLVVISPRVSMWVTSRKLLMRLESMRALRDKTKVQTRREDHVIIVGFGMNGRNLALVLRELEVPYIALDLNSRTVSEWREKGEPILYGDATSQEILIKLGIERARVIVIAINDAAASRKIVSTARILNPGIFIIVRTSYLAEVDDLIRIGADEVIPAEFETSIELFSRVLKFYHMPKSLIRDYAERFRRDHYEMFFKGETPKRLFHETIAVMPDVEYESFVVKGSSRAVGSTYRELRIQEQTGAMIIGVKRDGDIIRGLSDEFRFMEGDIVFLIGDKESLKKAGELYFE